MGSIACSGLATPDGEIDTGSKNVRVKGKGGRTAQQEKLPSPVLLASIARRIIPHRKQKKGTRDCLTRDGKYRHDDRPGHFLYWRVGARDQTNNAATA